MTLTEEQKRKAKIDLLNDKAKELLGHLDKLTSNDLAFQDWNINLDKWKLYAPNKLKLEFKLQETAMERRLQELDVSQRRIDEGFRLEEDTNLEEDIEDLELQGEEEIES